MTAGPSSVAAVLVDANVLYARVLRDFLLYSAAAELITVLWSPTILDEMTRHLIANVVGFAEPSARRLIDAMNRAFPYAEMTPSADDYALLADVELPDEDDRHVIAAALSGGATILCTANVKDFPEAVLSVFGIEIQTPDGLLDSLVRRHPAEMAQVLETTVANLKGATVQSTLAALRSADAPVAVDGFQRILRVTGWGG